MEPEVSLYWRMICKHILTEAHVSISVPSPVILFLTRVCVKTPKPETQKNLNNSTKRGSTLWRYIDIQYIVQQTPIKTTISR